MKVFSNDVIVFRTCLLLVKFFRNHQEEGRGAHSRIFNYILHPEKEYVSYGISESAENTQSHHPEHAVPCAVMRDECFKLIQHNNLGDGEIAALLMKHWKIVTITKEEQKILDAEYKSTMPEESDNSKWCFETGDTFARFTKKGIKITPR